MLHLVTHALLAQNKCVPNLNPVCTKEFRPVCAAGVTYANPCLAAAACHADDSTPGVCGESKGGGRALGGAPGPADYLLVGGVPIGSGPASNAAFGGHYTAAAPDNTGDHACTGGRVWNECGLKCTRDCDSPASMPCVLMCVPRCECPAVAPVWHGDECITADACPSAPEKAMLTRAGGFMAVDEAELAPGSKVGRLAAFGLSQFQSQVCAASNSLGCASLQGARLEEVVGASTQVVSGLNYRIAAQTSAGLLTMHFYEQPWTSTLELSEATLSSPVGGESMTTVVSSLLDQPLVLDAQAFETAPSSSTAAVPDEKAAFAPQTEAPPAHASLLLAPEQPLAAAPTLHPLQGPSRVSAEPQAAPAHPTLRTGLHVGLGAAVGAGFLLLAVKVSRSGQRGALKRETQQAGEATAHCAAGQPSAARASQHELV